MNIANIILIYQIEITYARIVVISYMRSVRCASAHHTVHENIDPVPPPTPARMVTTQISARALSVSDCLRLRLRLPPDRGASRIASGGVARHTRRGQVARVAPLPQRAAPRRRSLHPPLSPLASVGRHRSRCAERCRRRRGSRWRRRRGGGAGVEEDSVRAEEVPHADPTLCRHRPTRQEPSVRKLAPKRFTWEVIYIGFL